jgi:glycosyltransferase involved in cell wall biosynthesis
MRICHVNPFFYPYIGGTENFLFDLSKRLAKKHDVSVVTSLLEGTKRYEEYEGIRIYRIPSLVFKRLPAFLPPPYSAPLCFSYHFNKICGKEKPEIVHLHNRFAPQFDSVIFWKRLLGIPLFLTIHNSRPIGINPQTDFFGGLYDDTVGRVIMKSCDRIIGNSKYSLDVTAPADYPLEKRGVIYNGVDTKMYRKVKSDVKEKLGCAHLITSICRLLPQKGLEYLIKALPDVKADYHYIMMGDGPERANLQNLVNKLGLQKKVTIAGRVSDEYKMQVYSDADVFVLPSVYEPFGIVLVEAMAMECAVISTKAGGIPEVVDDTGILVEPRNPKQIAAGLQKLFDDRKLLDRCKKLGRKRTEDVFDWTIIAKQYEKSYKDCMSAISYAP